MMAWARLLRFFGSRVGVQQSYQGSLGTQFGRVVGNVTVVHIHHPIAVGETSRPVGPTDADLLAIQALAHDQLRSISVSHDGSKCPVIHIERPGAKSGCRADDQSAKRSSGGPTSGGIRQGQVMEMLDAVKSREVVISFMRKQFGTARLLELDELQLTRIHRYLEVMLEQQGNFMRRGNGRDK